MGIEGNEFIIFLVVGLAIIAFGILIFTSQVNFQSGSYNYGGNRYANDVGYDLISEDAGRSILVGTIQSLDSRVEGLGTFDVRTTSERVVLSKIIFSGVLFGDDFVIINGNIRDLQLDVFSTNNYGNLIVIAKDGSQTRVVVDKRLGVGKYTIPVDNDGTIEIRAASSGWRIWAPTIYNLKVGTDVYTKKNWRQDFVLEPNITRVDLKLYFTGYAGKLKVRLN